VRGYSLDDGAWDDGFVLRDELRAPPIPLVSLGPFAASFSGRIFATTASAAARRAGATSTPPRSALARTAHQPDRRASVDVSAR